MRFKFSNFSSSALVVQVIMLASAIVSIPLVEARPFVFLAAAVLGASSLGRKFGIISGIALTFLGLSASILLGQIVAFTMGWNSAITTQAIFWLTILAAITSSLLVARQGAQPRRHAGDLIAIYSIPIVVISTGFLGRFIDSMPGRSWIMRGDTANNLIFAWTIDQQGGINLDYFKENPVPFPASIINFFASLPSPGSRAEYIQNALNGVSIVWVLLVALASLAISISVHNMLKSWSENQVHVRRFVVIGASILPLTWVFSGYPIEAGFFGAQLELTILLLLLVVAFEKRNISALVIVAYLAVLITEMTWSPLLLAAGGVLAAVVLGNFRKIFSSVGLVLYQAVLVGVISFLAVRMTIPSFTTQTEVLAGATGGIHTFDHNFLPLMVTAALGLSALLYNTGAKFMALTAAAFTALGLIGLLFLLLLRRNQEGWWAYYQLKYEWFLLVMVTIIVVLLSVRLLANLAGQNWKIAVSWAALLAALIAVVMVLPSGSPRHAILGNFVGQSLVMDNRRAVADGIYLSFWKYYTADQPSILWGSELDDEFFVDFWLLQMNSENIADPLRGLAYGRHLEDMNELCQVVHQLAPNTRVVTVIPDLEQRFRAACVSEPGAVFVSP